MKLRADVIEKLDPSSGMDASRWFTRYELFVDISEGKAENELDRSNMYVRYLPLFLAGDALLCYEEMRDEEKVDYAVAKELLCEYYDLDESSAYNKFCGSRFEPGTSVDAFIAQLRRYAGVLELGKYNCDKLILAQFMQAIPAEAASEIRGRCGRDNEELQLSKVLRVARHLPSLSHPAPICALTEKPAQRGNPEVFSFKEKYARSRAEQHARQTQERKNRGVHAKRLACYACGGEHIMRECQHLASFKASLSGNGSGPAQ